MSVGIMEIANLPAGQCLQFFHRSDGSWAIVRLVFGPSLLSPIEKFKREGATLAEALSAEETRERD